MFLFSKFSNKCNKFKQLKKNFTLSENLRFSENHIVLGEKLFNRINLNIGDKIKLIIPKSSNTPFGNIPKTKKVRALYI